MPLYFGYFVVSTSSAILMPGVMELQYQEGNTGYNSRLSILDGNVVIFGHPIVYFPLFIFLGAIYFLAPRYGKERVPFFKWNYRTWPGRFERCFLISSAANF